MRTKRIGFTFGSLILICIVIVLVLRNYRKAEVSLDATETYGPKFTKNGELLFLNKELTDTLKKIDIEIADNEIKRTNGLMYRCSMPDSVGMLFIFEEEKPLSFWMKNTYIPLDIIFVNKSKEIVSVRENNPVLREWSIPSDFPSIYVVEVIAGFCSTYNIEVGDKIKFN